MPQLRGNEPILGLNIRKKTFFRLDNVKVKNQASIIDLMT
jgi:hypothetical protein